MSIRKPRSDSALKNLPSNIQEQIWQILRKNSYAKTIELLAKEFDVETNSDALSEFWSWYPLTCQLQEAASVTNEAKKILSELPGLNLDEEKLSKVGQVIFEQQAIKNRDSKLFVGLRQLRQIDAARLQKDREIEVKLRRLAILEAKEKQLQEAKQKLSALTNKGGLTKETIREIQEAAGLL